MINEESSTVQSRFTIPDSLNYQDVLKKARERFYALDPNIIGVNIAPRRVKNKVRPNDHALVVYVLDKKPQDDLDPAQVIPKDFMGLRTDVYAPLSADAPKATGNLAADRQISNDLSAVDWLRLHALAVRTPPLAPPSSSAKVQDFGDICVIEDDGTVLRTYPTGEQYVDFVRAYKLFRTVHGDDYDFVTFSLDPASGRDNGSFLSFIQNDVQGIGLGAFDSRPGWGTSRLQSFHLLSPTHFSLWRYVMLQEFGHRWAAFARYRDPVTGATMTDHFDGGLPAHWSRYLDDDKSPMDYDTYHWVELPDGKFSPVQVTSDERTYCNLDLYLMGLLGPNEVGNFYLLRDVMIDPISSQTFIATPVRLTIQNFIAQEGPRIPDVASAPKYWRQAFIVITRDIQKVHDFADTVDSLRLRWEQDFSQATKGLGHVDTVLDARNGLAANFTIVFSSRQGFGNEPGYLTGIESDVPFVGPTKDFIFSCPNVNSGDGAVLMFQSRDVDYSKNIITINGSIVYGGIPVSPNRDTWNGNVMLIGGGILRASGNVLHIEARNESGGVGGNIDDFILDNLVVMYKTR